MNYAFYGQAITTDRAAARLDRARQRAEAAARVQRVGGRIVVEYFDVYRDRYTGLGYRRQARRLLAATQDEKRAFDALIIADRYTALTANQYGDLLFICHEHGFQLWLPEIDEAVDADNPEHQAVMMDLFWGPAPRFMSQSPTIMSSATEDQT